MYIFGFIGITETEFIHANGLKLSDDAQKLSLSTARPALKTAIFA